MQMIASAVKRIGVEKVSAEVHNWIIQEAVDIMAVKKLNDTENLAIVGNMYGLLWYLKDAIDSGKVEKQQSD